MSGARDIFIQVTTSKKRDADEGVPEIFTGVTEKYSIKSGGEEHLEALTVFTDAKGQIVAVTLGHQILPFTRATADGTMSANFRTEYRRNLQGRILALFGERPKRGGKA